MEGKPYPVEFTLFIVASSEMCNHRDQNEPAKLQTELKKIIAPTGCKKKSNAHEAVLGCGYGCMIIITSQRWNYD